MLEQVERELVERGFKIVDSDLVKPWGGYFCIDDKQLDKFIGTYFPGVAELEDLTPDIHYSPKVLVVEPKKNYPGRFIIDVMKCGEWFKDQLGCI